MIPELQTETRTKVNVKLVNDPKFKVYGKGYAEIIDYLRVFQSILAQELPPKQYNGIMNVEYILHYENATSEEIESTLVTLAHRLSLILRLQISLSHLYQANNLILIFFRAFCMEMIPQRQKHRSSILMIFPILVCFLKLSRMNCSSL